MPTMSIEVGSGDFQPTTSTFQRHVVIIGRQAGCDLVLPPRGVVTRHASLRFQDGAVVIEDLKSQTGTRVDGVRVTTPTPLRDGSVIFISSITLKVSLHP